MKSLVVAGALLLLGAAVSPFLAHFSATGTVMPSSAEATSKTPSFTLVAFVPKPDAPSSEEVELGRMLFFDKRLSKNRSMSCATCHDPGKSFSDGRQTAAGFEGATLPRNTPTLWNLESRAPYFWDGRAPTLEAQALAPVTNGHEMAADLDQVLRDLGDSPEYLARFERVFPDAGVGSETVAQALAAFERTLISSDSPLDRYLAGDASALSREAKAGLALFVGKAGCAKCHDGAQLTDNGFHDIGVGDADEGRFVVSGLPVNKHAFKTPTLRDVALTAPYFHDGSAATLAAVVELYDKGGNSSATLDPEMRPLCLTPAEKASLVAFMESLTGRHETGTERPELPAYDVTPTAPSVKLLMNGPDGLLAHVERTAAAIQKGDALAVASLAGEMIALADQIVPLRERDSRSERPTALRENAGELLRRLRSVRAAARSNDLEVVRTGFVELRHQCDRCHSVFRPDPEEPASPPAAPRQGQ